MRKKKKPQKGQLFYFTEEEEERIAKAMKGAAKFMKKYGKGQHLCDFVRSKY